MPRLRVAARPAAAQTPARPAAPLVPVALPSPWIDGTTEGPSSDCKGVPLRLHGLLSSIARYGATECVCHHDEPCPIGSPLAWRKSSRSSTRRRGSCARTSPSCWPPAPRRSASRSSARCTSRSSRSAPRSAATSPSCATRSSASGASWPSAAERVGLAVAAAGTHPFSHWKDQVISPGVRYESIVEELQQLARSLLIFGLHVHVAVPGSARRRSI